MPGQYVPVGQCVGMGCARARQLANQMDVKGVGILMYSNRAYRTSLANATNQILELLTSHGLT
jgi:predicted nucleic acid-binding protein